MLLRYIFKVNKSARVYLVKNRKFIARLMPGFMLNDAEVLEKVRSSHFTQETIDFPSFHKLLFTQEWYCMICRNSATIVEIGGANSYLMEQFKQRSINGMVSENNMLYIYNTDNIEIWAFIIGREVGPKLITKITNENNDKLEQKFPCESIRVIRELDLILALNQDQRQVALLKHQIGFEDDNALKGIQTFKQPVLDFVHRPGTLIFIAIHGANSNDDLPLPHTLTHYKYLPSDLTFTPLTTLSFNPLYDTPVNHLLMVNPFILAYQTHNSLHFYDVINNDEYQIIDNLKNEVRPKVFARANTVNREFYLVIASSEELFIMIAKTSNKILIRQCKDGYQIKDVIVNTEWDEEQSVVLYSVETQREGEEKQRVVKIKYNPSKKD
ncbi:hypothetical protein FGO68_gene10191 [Halteria grandinella]|uniref:Uncharacterized protein n=1 Tax=Halteria grandinella TaxID=5974 RepID=A0A8J8NPF1_HALGN|nr:hypothetical protein FGO68_gene10191 [Halteria grandinella]